MVILAKRYGRGYVRVCPCSFNACTTHTHTHLASCCMSLVLISAGFWRGTTITHYHFSSYSLTNKAIWSIDHRKLPFFCWTITHFKLPQSLNDTNSPRSYKGSWGHEILTGCRRENADGLQTEKDSLPWQPDTTTQTILQQISDRLLKLAALIFK